MPANPSKESKRGTIEIGILACLEQGDKYGLEILDEMERRSGGAMGYKIGSVYPALHRMVRQGWLSARWEVSDTESPRKYYHLTAAGQRALDEKREEWQRVSEAMEAFMPRRSTAT